MLVSIFTWEVYRDPHVTKQNVFPCRQELPGKKQATKVHIALLPNEVLKKNSLQREGFGATNFVKKRRKESRRWQRRYKENLLVESCL